MRQKKNRFGVVATAATTLLILLLLCGGVALAQPSALVLDDMGDVSGPVAIMQNLGWNVTTASGLDLEVAGDLPGTLSQYDIVWMSAQTNHEMLRVLLETDALADFAKAGGIVVVVDVTPEHLLLDIAPGGADAEALPEGGAGSVSIAAPDHPMITGDGIGGVALTDVDLDPQATGGRGCVLNPPEGETSVVIAQNSLGAVVLEHSHGAGSVFLCTLENPTDACAENIVRYLASLVQ